MARIRSVHPGLFTDEGFVTLSPTARVFMIGLWTEADDQGVFEWKPITLKMRLLPVDNADINALLAELVVANNIKSYELDGRKYGAIRNFRIFQRPKKPNEIHVLPDEFRTYVGLSGDDTEPDLGIPHTSGENHPQMEGREGEDGEKGRGNGRATKILLTEAWQPSPQIEASLREKGYSDHEISWQLQRFKAHFIEKGERRPGWDRSFVKWVMGEPVGKYAKRDQFGRATVSPSNLASDPWEKRVADYRADLDAGKPRPFWPMEWGRPPGDLHCAAPDEILTRHGFTRQAAA